MEYEPTREKVTVEKCMEKSENVPVLVFSHSTKTNLQLHSQLDL